MRAEKIAVGMSGGVDSSVAAMLLQEAGHDVVGLTMLLRPQEPGETEDSLLRESRDAAAVCAHLGIPHHTLDFREAFQKEVVAYFAEAYLSGQTPNPCIRCNSSIKFGRMLEFALSIGCDAIATGHWAGIVQVGERWLLKKAESPKDQSYFLYTLTQHQLMHTRFPLITGEKEALRALARERGLPVANKPDSQDVCFIRDGDYIRFVEAYAARQGLYTGVEGNFVDSVGRTLGRHKGIYRYTVGQRRGLGIALGERRFVTGIDAAAGSVTLGGPEDCLSRTLTVKDLNWIPFDTLTEEREVLAKPRYRAKPAQARLIPKEEGTVLVEFHQLQRFLTPGQAVVFYDTDEGKTVIGGGTIM